MSKPYKINFEQLRQEGLKELFGSLEKAFDTLGIDFYIVGAIARDTWFAHSGIKTIGTADVDFAVYIPEKENFLALKKYLQEKEGFNVSSQNQFAVFSPKGMQVDLLPFGEIEVEGKVMLEGKELAKIAVNGFREVYETALAPVEYSEDHIFKVCTLPGIVILKLITFDDRPEARQKDIGDIGKILQHYFDIESDIIYEHHNDLFDSTAELPLIAARVLGRQMQIILSRSAELKKRIASILELSISNKENSPLIRLLSKQGEMDIDFSANLLSEMLAGTNDKISNKSESNSLSEIKEIIQKNKKK